jgi:hypothetical protein
MKIFQPTISGSFTVSGSVFLKGLTSVAQSNVILVNTTTGQLYYTASSAIGGGGGGGTVDTSSLVTTASFNAYTGSNISQFAGTASYVTLAATATNALSASNFVITSTLRLDQTLTDFATVASTIVGSNNLFNQTTGSFTSAFGKYTLYNGVNARSGEFWTTWNGTTTTYTDTSTTDIGNTATITFNSTIVGSDVQINAVAGASGWTVKMLTTFI